MTLFIAGALLYHMNAVVVVVFRWVSHLGRPPLRVNAFWGDPSIAMNELTSSTNGRRPHAPTGRARIPSPAEPGRRLRMLLALDHAVSKKQEKEPDPGVGVIRRGTLSTRR